MSQGMPRASTSRTAPCLGASRGQRTLAVRQPAPLQKQAATGGCSVTESSLLSVNPFDMPSYHKVIVEPSGKLSNSLNSSHFKGKV